MSAIDSFSGQSQPFDPKVQIEQILSKTGNTIKQTWQGLKNANSRSFYETRFYEIYSGECDIATGESLNSNKILVFLAIWFADNNIGLIYNDLSQLDIEELHQFAEDSRESDREHMHPSEYFAGLMYGKGNSRIGNSSIYSFINKVAENISGKNSDSYYILHRIAFLLALPASQRDNLLRKLIMEFEPEQRITVVKNIDRVRNELLSMTLEG